MTIAEALRIVGGLSEPSKMPCFGYSLPAPGMGDGVGECPLGAKLVNVPGTVCSRCYARKGRYVFPNVKRAMQRRAFAISRPGWINAMVHLIKARRMSYFRWHDSGDLQGTWHFAQIIDVARRTPRTRHWLPTRERATVAKLADAIPRNLTVRLSATRIGELPRHTIRNVLGSAVDASEAFQCPAPQQGGHCRDCRACWDRRIKVISYTEH